MVGVVTHQGGKIECDGETGLAMLEQEFVAAIGVGGAAEAGELPHRPQLAAVHRRMNAAREWILRRDDRAVSRRRNRSGQRLCRRLFCQWSLIIPSLVIRGSTAPPFLTCSRTSAATSYGLRVPAATSSSRPREQSFRPCLIPYPLADGPVHHGRVRAAKRRLRRSTSFPVRSRNSWCRSRAVIKMGDALAPWDATVRITGASQALEGWTVGRFFLSRIAPSNPQHHFHFLLQLISARTIALVDHIQLGDFHDSCLERLDAIARLGYEHQHRRLGGGGDVQFGLPHSDSLNEECIEPKGLEHVRRLLQSWWRGHPVRRRVAIDRINTPGSRLTDSMRIRSPSSAPPVKGLVGSTAMTATLRPRSR